MYDSAGVSIHWDLSGGSLGFGLMMYLLPVGSRHYGVGLEFRDFTSAARFHLFLRLLKAATTIPSRAQAHILTQNVDDGSVLCSRIEMPSF